MALSAERVAELQQRVLPLSQVVWGWNLANGQDRALRERVRQEASRKAQPSLAIIDSQSVSTTEVGAEHGFEGAKKVNGRNRHILVHTLGNLLKVLSPAANIAERAGAEKLLLKVPEKLWTRWAKILADGGYEGVEFQAGVEQTFDVEFEISLRPTAHKGFVLVPISIKLYCEIGIAA